MQVGTRVLIKSINKTGTVVECCQFPHGRVPSDWLLVKIDNYGHSYRTSEFFDPNGLEVLPEVIEQVVEVKMHLKGDPTNTVWIQLRDDRNPNKPLWAINDSSGLCLNKDLKWEWESMPSSRTDEFLERCRFSLTEAKDLIHKYFRSINE